MTINSKLSLAEAIQQLERKKLMQEEELKEQFKVTQKSLNPLNLIKDGVKNITSMPGLGDGLIKSAIGMGIGILTKNLFIGKSSSIVKKLLGGAVEIGVANTTVSYADKVKAYGISIYHNLFKKGPKQNHNGLNLAGKEERNS